MRYRTSNCAFRSLLILSLLFPVTFGHHGADKMHKHDGGHKHAQAPITAEQELWASKYGLQVDLPFTGPLSFAHLPYTRCLDDPSTLFDIAILVRTQIDNIQLRNPGHRPRPLKPTITCPGLPFDTAVTFRPGARFGPYGIRSGSRRQREQHGYTLGWQNNPYAKDARVIDCGDVPISPFDNALAIDQIEVAYTTLINRPPSSTSLDSPSANLTKALALDGRPHPRIVSLGGDHTIVLPILRSLKNIYGPISVIHFDSHLDTWPPARYKGTQGRSKQAQITHGTFFWAAAAEGLIASNSSIHAGIRCKLGGIEDLEHDASVGFSLISTDDIDDLGIPEIIRRIRARVGANPVYLSLDIDVIDPGLAPATGTPEAGGWTTRELKRILRGLAGLNYVGFDLVEVAPAYDTNAEITSIAAADLIHDFLSMMLFNPAPNEVPGPKEE